MLATVGACGLWRTGRGLLIALAFVGPHFTKWSYTDHDFENFLTGPSGTHWFGTDQTGLDLYAATMRGAQKSILIGLFVALCATGIAAVVGAAAGYFGGWTDRVLMWIVDLLLVVPAFLIIVLGGVGSLWGAVAAGLLVGLAVGLTGAYASEWSLMSMYLLFIAVVTFRSRGLFGKKSILDT